VRDSHELTTVDGDVENVDRQPLHVLARRRAADGPVQISRRNPNRTGCARPDRIRHGCIGFDDTEIVGTSDGLAPGFALPDRHGVSTAEASATTPRNAESAADRAAARVTLSGATIAT